MSPYTSPLPQWERGCPHTVPHSPHGRGDVPIHFSTSPTGVGMSPYIPPLPQWERGCPHTLLHSPHGRGDVPIHSSANTFNVCRDRFHQSPKGFVTTSFLRLMFGNWHLWYYNSFLTFSPHQQTVAATLGVPNNRIVCKSKRLGKCV